MKKLEKNDYRNLSILIFIVFAFILILLFLGYIFGSKIDWANQHIVFPEYFRNIFYKTGNIIPGISLNLGMGQNIYYFSYYGFLSPIVLISYIFPFIPMHIYMLIAAILSLIASIILFYRWILDKYNSKIALIASLILLFNSTYFYHFHRHLMFVIYMPFLILSLIGVDKYFKNKNILTLIISTFLIIMTNYYFGAYSCIVIFIYAIYLLLKEKKLDIKKISKIVYLEIISIFLSGILLLPTIYALLNGRIETLTSSINIIKLLSPMYNFDYTFYSSYYSWGITFIYVIALIFGFISKDKSRKFISIIMSLIIVFPAFSFILNGGMYVDGKCYLPFLPLSILQICDFINDIVNEKIVFKKYIKYIAFVIVFLIICCITKISVVFLIFDALLTLLVLYKSDNFKNKYLAFIPAIIIGFMSFVFSSFNEKYISIKTFNEINDEKYYQLSEYINEEDLYRLSIEDNKRYTMNKVYNLNNLRTTIYSSLENINYHSQVRNVFQNETLNRDNFVLSQTSNVLFNIYSGTKYLITSKDPLIGYTKIKTIGNTSLYENNDVLPIMYASNNVMSKREFDNLEYPYQLEALLNYIIVAEEKEDVFSSQLEKYNLNPKIMEINNLEYSKNNNHYNIIAKNNSSVNIKIDPIENKVLIIKFKMNKYKDGFACSSDIIINEINNSLSCSNWKYNNKNETFEYVISSNDIIDELNIKFSESDYDISDIEVYTLDYELLKNIKNNVQKLNFNISDNKIISNYTFDSDNYVKTTIPYENNGYKLYIDDKESEIIKVDDTYIGFKIPRGTHKITLSYSIPYLKEGKIISLIGIILLIVTFIIYKLNINIISIYKKYEEIINYIIIGCLTTLISLVVYYLLTLTFMNPNNAIELQITNIISWIISVTFAYFTNRKLVFKKENKVSIKEAIEFYLSRITTLILDILFMYLFVTLLHFNDKIIKLIVQIIIIILNYVLSKFIVFKKNKK